MDQKHYVLFINSGRYSGPFYSFQAAFNEVAKFQQDARIELEDDTVIATWSKLTGLYKLNAKYKYLVTDCQFNREICPELVGQTFDVAPVGAMVQDVEVAS